MPRETAGRNVYCDPPYIDKEDYYRVEVLDHEAFRQHTYDSHRLRLSVQPRTA